MQYDRIGAGIAQRRKQMGLSQEELAKQLGVTRQAVSKWESGAALPSVDNIVELARVLEISVDELLQLEKKSSQPGLSAEGVGLILDEHSARQEKRIRRLTIALIAAACVLVIGIVVSALIGMQRTNRMEENLNRRIADTNTQLHTQINGIQSSISHTVKQALDEGSTLLADSGCRGETYIHETNSVALKLFAYPKALGEYSDAEFYALLTDGTRVSVPAELTAGGFEGTLTIPAGNESDLYVTAYVSWTQDGQMVTERIMDWSIWMDYLRMRLDFAGLHYLHHDITGKTTLLPYASIVTSDSSPETYPAKALFEIYAGSEMIASVGMPCEWGDGMMYGTISPEEDVILDGKYQYEDLSMRVTVTDRRGNEFVKEWKYEGE